MSYRKKKRPHVGRCQINGNSKADIIEMMQRHSDYGPKIINRIEKIPETILKNLASKEARDIDKMVRQPFRELEGVKQFTRTKLNDRGILYGAILVSHHIEDLICEYFHRRFPKCWICLFNEYNKKTLIQQERGKWFYWECTLEEALIKLNQNRPLQPYFEDIQIETEDLFNTFYASQYIQSRKNPRYYRQMIPKKLHKKLPSLRGSIEGRLLNSLENTSMDKFISKKVDKSSNKNT